MKKVDGIGGYSNEEAGFQEPQFFLAGRVPFLAKSMNAITGQS